MDNNTITIDAETADKLRKLTKNELIDKFAVAALEAETYKLRVQVAVDDARAYENNERILKKTIAELETKLAKAESYVEQGRAMIDAVMERWYEYDV